MARAADEEHCELGGFVEETKLYGIAFQLSPTDPLFFCFAIASNVVLQIVVQRAASGIMYPQPHANFYDIVLQYIKQGTIRAPLAQW